VADDGNRSQARLTAPIERALARAYAVDPLLYAEMLRLRERVAKATEPRPTLASRTRS